MQTDNDVAPPVEDHVPALQFVHGLFPLDDQVPAEQIGLHAAIDVAPE